MPQACILQPWMPPTRLRRQTYTPEWVPGFRWDEPMERRQQGTHRARPQGGPQQMPRNPPKPLHPQHRLLGFPTKPTPTRACQRPRASASPDPHPEPLGPEDAPPTSRI